VYAVRSISLSTVAGALGASVSVAVAVAAIAGIACLGAAALLAGRADGWPNYAALLFVPIAITWPRLAPAWFFGYVAWVLGELSPKPVANDVCCRPPDVPEQAWGWSHAEPILWYAAGMMAIVAAVTIAAAAVVRRASSAPTPSAKAVT
jgi:hypothetical protein